MWKRGEIAPKEQFLLFSTLFCYFQLSHTIKAPLKRMRTAVLMNIFTIYISAQPRTPPPQKKKKNKNKNK